METRQRAVTPRRRRARPPRRGGFGLLRAALASFTVGVVVIAGAIATGTAAVAAAPFYVDVPADSAYFDDIQWATAQGLTTGYPAASGRAYRPTATVRAQEAAQFLYRYAGDAASLPSSPTFVDVPLNHAFAADIEWMASAGLDDGIPNAAASGVDFHPDATITRGKLADYLARLAGSENEVSPIGFTDVPSTHPYAASIWWAISTGVANSYPDADAKAFHPDEPVTRQDLAAFVHRFDRNVESGDDVRIVQISASVGGTSFAVDSGGSLYAWGDNQFGLIGNGSVDDEAGQATPVRVPGLNGVVAVDAGITHAVALDGRGAVWSWGRGWDGQLGRGGGSQGDLFPVIVPGLSSIVEISAGPQSSAARTAEGGVYVWGGREQLNDGTWIGTTSPVLVPELTGIVDVEATGSGLLAIDGDGRVHRWSFYGSSVGDGPTVVPGLEDIVEVSASSGGHFLAVRSDGILFAWGANNSGQLGDGTQTDRIAPVVVPGLPGIADAVAAGQYSLALATDGRVYSWGAGNGGAWIGDGWGSAPRTAPVQIPGLSNVAQIAGGDRHSFALQADGTIQGWGRNASGQLGDGTTDEQLNPVPVTSLIPTRPVQRVAAGSEHGLAIGPDGEVYAWGDNEFGQLGDGSTTSHPLPAIVPGLSRITGVYAGTFSSMAVDADGVVWAWGIDIPWRSGGFMTHNDLPTKLAGLPPIAALSVGDSHVLAIAIDGTVYAWGANSSGQIGDGTFANRPSPVRVAGLSGIVDVSAYGLNSMALAANGTVYAWGSNSDGQLGVAGYERSAPVAVPGVPRAVDVGARGSLSLVVGVDGLVYSWGRSDVGELGDGGTTVTRSMPTRIHGLTGIQAVDAGGSFVVARDASGAVFAWGANQKGQLGGGRIDSPGVFSPPREVIELAGVTSIDAATGGNGALAVRADGGIFSWGAGEEGQIGDGNVVSRATPVQIFLGAQEQGAVLDWDRTEIVAQAEAGVAYDSGVAAISEPTAARYAIAAPRYPVAGSTTGLPPGLSLDPATGRISGTPTASGDGKIFAFAVEAWNADDPATFIFTSATITVGAGTEPRPGVASVTADITTAFAGGSFIGGTYTGGTRDDPAVESALANLVADAFLDTLAPTGTGAAQIAFVAPGELHDELRFAPDGVITRSEARAVLSPSDELATVDLSGEQVIDLLEQQWQIDSAGGVPTRPYLQLGTSAGFTYTFDPDPDDDGRTTGDLDDQGAHITSVALKGIPLVAETKYRVGATARLVGTGDPASGGADNFTVFREGTDHRDSGIGAQAAWIDYLAANSPVSPSFAAHGIALTGAEGTWTAGGTKSLAARRLDLTSLGAPENTTLRATYGATPSGSEAVEVGEGSIVAGAATIDVTIPAGASGAGYLVLTAAPSGTVVAIPVALSASVAASSTVASAPQVAYGAKPTVKITVSGVRIEPIARSSGDEPSGRVTVVDESGTLLGAGDLVGGSATVALPAAALRPGSHVLTVAYSGDSAFAGSTSTTTLIVTKARSRVGGGSTTPARVNQAATLTILGGATGRVEVDGDIVVEYQGARVGSGTFVAGRAEVTISPMASAGVKVFTVRYLGSDTVDASAGNAYLRVR
jgi:alpha-tubulin suppressor-like RCC1 family protein